MLSSTSRRSTPPARRRLLPAIGALMVTLLLAPLALAGPASARAEQDRPERADRVERPETDRKRHRDLAVIRLRCEVADGRATDRVDEAERIHIGCKWRPVKHEKAAGYQLWRIVDRGERELVARGGLEMLSARDAVPAETKVVRYAVIAVDENGRRVGQSRVEKLVFEDGPTDRVRPVVGTRRSVR